MERKSWRRKKKWTKTVNRSFKWMLPPAGPRPEDLLLDTRNHSKPSISATSQWTWVLPSHVQVQPAEKLSTYPRHTHWHTYRWHKQRLLTQPVTDCHEPGTAWFAHKTYNKSLTARSSLPWAGTECSSLVRVHTSPSRLISAYTLAAALLPAQHHCPNPGPCHLLHKSPTHRLLQYEVCQKMHTHTLCKLIWGRNIHSSTQQLAPGTWAVTHSPTLAASIEPFTHPRLVWGHTLILPQWLWLKDHPDTSIWHHRPEMPSPLVWLQQLAPNWLMLIPHRSCHLDFQVINTHKMTTQRGGWGRF